MKKLISFVLTICFLTSSLVQAEAGAEYEMMRLLSSNLENGKVHFNQLDETKMTDMSLERFEEKLSKTLIRIQKKNNKVLEHGTADEIANKYQKIKKTLLQNDHGFYWGKIFADIEKDGSTSIPKEKAWLGKINNDDFRSQFKDDLMEDVQRSGSVGKYYKELKKKLLELKKQDVDIPIEHILLTTFALMIIIGIFLLVFSPIGAVAFVVGLACVSTPMVFFLALIIRQLIDPITCFNQSASKQLNFNV